MVHEGEVKLIDVAFVQVRPSPWRQAIDLANMMLVLAVGTDAKRVYDRALQFFTPEEIAEAFAATRGIASPTQLRAVMKQDGRDLVAEFRSMAPDRRPIPLQRWGVRTVRPGRSPCSRGGAGRLNVIGNDVPPRPRRRGRRRNPTATPAA